MDINWKAPFEFAFELGLFMLGAILVLMIIFVSILVVFGLIRGFVGAVKRARGNSEQKSSKPFLRSVKEKE